MVKVYNKLWFAVIMMMGSLFIGTMGFMAIEEFSLLQAFYMTVITFSTVGLREVQPLTEGGQLFISIYIIFNLGVFAYVISVFSSYLFEGELRKALRNFLIGRELKNLKDHIIICGFGRNGVKAAEVLFKENRKFVIIENDIEAINTHAEFEKYQFLQGDATLDEVLMEAGIEKAATMITTLPKDSDNVFITLTARQLNPTINIIARASEVQSEKKLVRAGASKVVMPDNLGGAHMAQLITRPYVIEFLEVLGGAGDKDLLLEEVPYDRIKDEYAGKSLGEMNVRARTGVSIIAIKVGERYQFNPEPDSIMGEGDVAILLGDQQKIDDFFEMYCS